MTKTLKVELEIDLPDYWDTGGLGARGVVEHIYDLLVQNGHLYVSQAARKVLIQTVKEPQAFQEALEKNYNNKLDSYESVKITKCAWTHDINNDLTK